MAAAEPVRIRGRDGKLQLVFRGERQRLEFVTAMPERHVKAGLYKVALYLVPEGGSGASKQTFALMLEMAPFPPPRGLEQHLEGHVTELLTEVETFEIGYFGDPAADGQPEWHPRWEQSVIPPSLIRILIGLSEERHLRGKTLVV